MDFARKVIPFLGELRAVEGLEEGISILNPYANKENLQFCAAFYKKFFPGDQQRVFILGINPGRLGAGSTGIPFTDSICLQTDCGIPHSQPRRRELSSAFLYEVIGAFGGPGAFYHSFYMGSVCPLGFTGEGRNMNYYDSPKLLKAVEEFCVRGITRQLDFGLSRSVAICLGAGRNFEVLSAWNGKHHFFREILCLPHPRFIMQYRRKQKERFIGEYLDTLDRALDILNAAGSVPG